MQSGCQTHKEVPQTGSRSGSVHSRVNGMAGCVLHRSMYLLNSSQPTTPTATFASHSCGARGWDMPCGEPIQCVHCCRVQCDNTAHGHLRLELGKALTHGTAGLSLRHPAPPLPAAAAAAGGSDPTFAALVKGGGRLQLPLTAAAAPLLELVPHPLTQPRATAIQPPGLWDSHLTHIHTYDNAHEKPRAVNTAGSTHARSTAVI